MSVILPRRFIKSIITDACDVPVSSYSYNGKSRTVFNNNCITMDWSPTGEFLWLGLKTDRHALSNIGGTNWDVTGRGSPANYKYGFIPEVVSGGSVWSMLITTAPDGTPGGQMLLNLAFGLAFCEIAQYTMPVPYNLRQGNPPATSPPYYPGYTPVYVGSYDTTVDTIADSINDMRMSPDGTRIIASISRPPSNSYIIQWNLTTPYDPLGGMSYQTPVAMTGYGFNALYVPPSGKCLYLGSSGTISQFTMGSAWEISTLNTTPVDTLDISSEFTGTVASIYATENDLYALRSNAGDVFQYER